MLLRREITLICVAGVVVSLSEQRIFSCADFSNCSFKSLVETLGISSSSGVSMTIDRRGKQGY
jgi:hypothetical protein